MALFGNDKNVKTDVLYDIAVIGAGPAGLTAVIYALRDNKNVILFEKEEVGGQALNSNKIVNIPGFSEVNGYDFIEKVVKQINSIETGSLSFVEEEVVNALGDYSQKTPVFDIITNDRSYKARSVIIATGSKYRTLGVLGEEDLIGRGISFCSTCDAPFYKGKEVVVIGGGNSAVTEAIELSRFASQVFILQNLEELTAQKGLIEELNKIENIRVVTGVKILGFFKDKDNRIIVDYETYMAADYGWIARYKKVDGVFLAIGMEPQNEAFKNLAWINDNGYIKDTFGLVKAVGDCKEKDVRQIATACGDGAEAAVNLCKDLNRLDEI